MDTRLHRFLYVSFVLLILRISQAFAIADNAHVGNASVQCIEKERQSLLALKQGFVDSDGMLSSWGNAVNQTDCCKWDGVSCSNRTGHVVKLDLGVYSLEGTLNPSLSELHHLNYLDLRGNRFKNLTFPKFIASLTHLQYLDLSSANVKGNIPYQLGGLFRLAHLDLTDNELTGRIPPQLGNLSSLQFLDLTSNFFIGTIPPTLGNLSMLKYFKLEPNFDEGGKPNLRSDLQWVSHLASLNTLHLTGLDLSDAKNWIPQVSNLTHLQELSITSCNLVDSEPWPSVSNNINSSSLASIDLSGNNLTSLGILFPWLLSYRDSIVRLDLSDNHLSDHIQKDFGNISSLEELYLVRNQLEGEIPQSLLDLCSLRFLYLHMNNLSGHLEDSVPSSSDCVNKSLEVLDLSYNQIVGSVPDLSQFSSLTSLDISHNKLNGTISKGIGHLSNLGSLDIAYNSLHGVITEAHFLRLSKLLNLDLSFNALVFNVSHAWVPPFQLDRIILASCKLGPTFPIWLRTQNHSVLDISSAQISSVVPKWFWDLNPQQRSNLNLSHNQISGKIPKLQPPFFDGPYMEIDLSSNLFEGVAPSYLAMNAASLDISNNKFTDANSLLCPNMATGLVFLDISNNQFSGLLPDCWTYFEELMFLNVENNSFSGKIPTSIGSLRYIQALHLGNNRFTGEIPLSLSKCRELRIFDVAQNNLAGLMPNWMGDELSELLVLSLRSNKFFGSLPYNFCHLSQVQILDLSLNNISGRMPKCLNNLSGLAAQTSPNATITYTLAEIVGDSYNQVYFADSASLIWKGIESKYRSTLGLVRSIDLSSNMLIGEIPSEMMDLVGLVSLNISRNQISGEIPAAIGRLKSLDFLDLSRNQLFGKIPLEISQIDRLSVMDLSYNNLSGEIPHGIQLQSFNASTYMGNLELCGAPLPKCPTKQTEDHQNDGNSEEDEQFFDRGFFISLSAGFSTGFWAVCSILFVKKSWTYAYFKFLGDAYDKVYVMVAVNLAKLRRRIRGSPW